MNAMKYDMESIKTNHVWDLVDLSLGQKAINNKLILKVKCQVNNFIE
jgi:hypothetical protein